MSKSALLAEQWGQVQSAGFVESSCLTPLTRSLIGLMFNVKRYTLSFMIKSFRCPHTQALFETGKNRRFSGIANVAMRKLAQLDAAETLEFLRAPPGNRLELLKGDRAGQHSMRINDQYRLCFRWTDVGPETVEIVDYH